MTDLQQLIEKFGNPDALIDHWDTSSQRFAIWGFEETFSINSNGIAQLNGESSDLPPLELWQKTLDIWKSESNELSAVGFISYDFKNFLFPHIPFKKPDSHQPLLWFGKPKQVIPFDLTETESAKSSYLQLKKDIPSPHNYQNSINTIKTALRNGDSYQINFTQPKQYELNGSPLDIYLSMRESVHPHYGMYLNLEDFQILSFSPERFFRTSGKNIESFPMKGTRPRSNDLIIDERLAGELYQSEKDRAEHLMIVDLIRNDIGKICNFGSVNVDGLYCIQSFETVHQMVSRVFGELHQSVTETEIITALFPGGSITGAPKEKSMEIIDSLEGYQRGVYTGSLGFILTNGDMDFNIAIRTMTIQNEIGIYPVGGGIVWDSDSLEEWQEAQQKGAILKPFCHGFQLQSIGHKNENLISNH
ncbi:MAG: aminodeoxychorismate synthase component I [Candidatus Marinimicrobia bacterium]|nr:aminodeoxychorismate synthase component I [Candidatus Neomarinimicrobiota bacterium]